MSQTKEIPELFCPICLSLFNTPVTIECGHTFCRYCLLQSVESKNICPICRRNISHLMERPNQDQVIFSILNQMNKTHTESNFFPLQQADLRIDTPISSIFLVDISTADLLLPFTKVTATFELQSPALICKLTRFVARQEPPFNRYGVISRVCRINELKYNTYQCTIEGIAFCCIEKEWVERNVENEEEYFYRCCKGEEMQEYSQMEVHHFDHFFSLFSQVKQPKTLQYVYNSINPHVFSEKKDPIALYYSIMRVINVPLLQKYEIIIKFDEGFRMSTLNQYLRQIEHEQKGVRNLIWNPKNRFLQGCLVGCVMFFLFLAIAWAQSEF